MAGVIITALIILGVKNTNNIVEKIDLWKKQIDEDNQLKEWLDFANDTLEELYEKREIVQRDEMDPTLDIDYRWKCVDLRNLIDKYIDKKKWNGEEYIPPKYSQNGPYLLSDD